MSSADLTPRPPTGPPPRVPPQQEPPHPHGSSPAPGHHGHPLMTAVRRAGILVGTAVRVAVLGRDGVDR
ncbi:hypothetical protein [Streptacidiphilus sp. ASG 303]|uniref:hypothetical protein n=1 Tax=Streptomycetaceae TaxID=2062 RepID=UPI001E3AFDC6|nr:hypothetical protein [Streptacidiphilus sp. ASG 303]MCD0485730.1 hypothetical protein [Streptacidiphilus sp. ASG 303]